MVYDLLCVPVRHAGRQKKARGSARATLLERPVTSARFRIVSSLTVRKAWSPKCRCSIFLGNMEKTGLIQLAANIRESWHPAQMARAAASSNSKGTAVYIIPWFWAQARSPSTDVQLVWPEDGALTSPIYLLIKESARAVLKPIIECITGAEMGAKSAQACFPSLHPDVDNKLPENASFKWLGWEYIKSNDLEQLKAYTTEVFSDAWRNKGKV